MIKLLDRFLKKKPHVPLAELESYIDTEVKMRKDKLQKCIEQAYHSISEEKDSAKKKAQDLLEKQLYNDAISQREKDIMEGNRDAYVKSVKQFLAKIPLFDAEHFDEQLKEFKDAAEKFTVGIAKQKHVTSQFFLNDIRAIESH